MLVISQTKGTKIQLGRDITITVLDLKSGKVRLGIEAPKDVKISYNKKEQEKIEVNLDNP